MCLQGHMNKTHIVAEGIKQGIGKNRYETILGVYICEVLCKYFEYNLFIAISDGNIFKLLSYLI